MGRGGKKKGDKKNKETEDVSTTEALSTSDVPSTSTSTMEVETTTKPTEPEEDNDIGLGGGKKRNPRKKKSTQETAASLTETGSKDQKMTGELEKSMSSLTLSQPPTSGKPSEEEIKPSGPDEDTGLGLGLGGGKKRNPRKKKKNFVPIPITISTSTATATATAEVPVIAQDLPSPSVSEVPFASSQKSQASSGWSKPQLQPQSSQQSSSGYGGTWRQQQPTQPSSRPPIQHSERTSKPQRPVEQTPYASTTGAGPAFQSCFRIPHKIITNAPQAKYQSTKVLTNYLKMNIEPRKIHRYDVTFRPDKVKKLIPKAFIMAKNLRFPKAIVAFDQMKNCYTLNPFSEVPENERLIIKVEVTDNNGKKVPFEVSFKHTGVVDLDKIIQYMKTGGTSLNPPSEAIQCVDVILRQGTLESYVKSGRQFYKRPLNPVDLSDGLEMWTGLFQSAIFTSRPFVNIDVVHKGFPKSQPLLTAFMKDFGLNPNQNLMQRNWAVSPFKDFIRGLKVVAAIGGDTTAGGQKREFVCNGTVGPANEETFEYTDPNSGRNTRMTVADFFTKIKGVRLQYPNLNCVWVGSKSKTIYYPMELLEVSYGQANNKQLTEKQLATMVKEAATAPSDRKRKIEEVIRSMNYPKNENFKKFGLTIDDQFHLVDAKILAPPQLEVAPGRSLTPRKGAWQTNGLLKASSWKKLNVISLMMKVAGEMGMTASRPEMTQFNGTMRDLQYIFVTALKKGIKFLFVIVGTRARDLYHKVKRTAEREVGILTQCVKEFTMNRRMNAQTARNILLKVNSKLMGINHALDTSSLPRCLSGGDVMVVGADVTHPSPDQSSVPSIAAVTASIDPKCYQYNIELSIQTPKREMIMQFEDMMVDHLKVYKQKQNKLPRKIYVFRDGVSEGQFAQVMASELTAVHNAYQRMTGNPNMKPEVLFLLVQKRHHTRLFVPNSPQNVEPGTVVDKEIVHATELDFYLVSHQAIKGTARPTRYHAVCNDGKIPSDEVEQLTYYLCHLYSRCMRAVSYPTPTYYAHLACLRAKSLTHGERYNNNELERRPQRLHVMDSILQLSRMFFV
ncbi:protein argonaute-2-like [Achroia grisella]|uniref:protein argonaute-2-like n=1 Tax=Achroia grisella TaxID=688607 RepID=UPI0027D301AB|nr:protein argonaute-2-like [Achroia grisella]